MATTNSSFPALSENCAELIGETLGLRVRIEDLPTLKVHIAERMKNLGLERPDDYSRTLTADAPEGLQEREILTARLTTGESYFLRDPKQFEVIIRQLLPELLRLRASTRKLRLWSAGCSSGEEPYTLAMLLHEQASELNRWDIEIFASDINSRALESAREGRYTEWAFRALDIERKRRYFRQEGHEWIIQPALRERVRFGHVDLVAETLPNDATGQDHYDLILCRNVFIYMTPAAISRVAGKLTATLADGGYLITGHGELLGHNTHGLHTRVFADSVVLSKHPPAPEPTASQPHKISKSSATVAVPLPQRLRPVSTPALCKRLPLTTLGPPLSEELLKQAWCEADRGQIDSAKRTCREYISVSPFDPWPYYLQAQLEQMAGNPVKAKTLLMQAIYLAPGLVAAYLELAALLEVEGQPARARQQLTAAVRELRRLPSDTLIRPYEHSTAADVLGYVERRLGNTLPHVARNVERQRASS